jgi:hypothetical protein
MIANQQEILFQDDPELVAELLAIRQRQEEHLRYEEASLVRGNSLSSSWQSRCLIFWRSECVNIVQPE